MASGRKFLLHVRCIEAKNLPGMDSSGYSDPYVKFKIGKDKRRTRVIKKTLFPVYNQDFTFVVKLDTKNKDEEFRIEVCEKDRLGKPADIGVMAVPLMYLERAGQIHGWFPLNHPKTGQEMPGAALNLSICVDKATPVKEYKDEEKGEKDKAFVKTRTSILYRIGRAAELKDKEERESKDGKNRDNVTLFVGSWNVGNAPPPTDLSPWIPKVGYDIYVIGAQECKYAERSPHKGCKEDWIATLKGHIGGGQGYYLVEESSMWQIRIVIFAREKHRAFIHSIEKSTEATGVGNVMGNKGGVVISFSIHDLSLCFVNSHLAAHQSKVAKRNADVQEVVNGIRMGFKHQFDILNQYHHVFWLGDLNYRINYKEQKKTPSPELFAEMVGMIKGGKLHLLFEHDQLYKEMAEKRVFLHFKEGACNFPPTFKVKKGEKLTYNEQRSPAWCDRILWRSFEGFEVKQSAFNSAEGIMTSDHKPVYGTFNFDIFQIPDATDYLLGLCTLTVTKLRCHKLPVGDVGGTSDPFVEFYGHFIHGNLVKSTVKKKTLDPVWDDKEIPPMPLTVNSKARLGYSFVLIRVFDHDVGSAPDLLCSGVIPLRAALTGKVTPFTLELSSGGLPAGILECNLQLTWDETLFTA